MADQKKTDAAALGRAHELGRGFPHLTVLENLTLAPLWVGKTPRKAARITSYNVCYTKLLRIAMPFSAVTSPKFTTLIGAGTIRLSREGGPLRL